MNPTRQIRPCVDDYALEVSFENGRVAKVRCKTLSRARYLRAPSRLRALSKGGVIAAQSSGLVGSI